MAKTYKSDLEIEITPEACIIGGKTFNYKETIKELFPGIAKWESITKKWVIIESINEDDARLKQLLEIEQERKRATVEKQRNTRRRNKEEAERVKLLNEKNKYENERRLKIFNETERADRYYLPKDGICCHCKYNVFGKFNPETDPHFDICGHCSRSYVD